MRDFRLGLCIQSDILYLRIMRDNSALSRDFLALLCVLVFLSIIVEMQTQ